MCRMCSLYVFSIWPIEREVAGVELVLISGVYVALQSTNGQEVLQCGSDLVFIPFDSSGRRCVGQVCSTQRKHIENTFYREHILVAADVWGRSTHVRWFRVGFILFVCFRAAKR
jgi:hypothetical protein